MRYHPLLLVLLLLACSGTEGQPGEVAERWTLEPDLVIGGASEGPESFADIRGLVVDSLGRIYVLEFDAKEIRVFDSTGVFQRTLGREGQGPGEFVYPDGLMLGTSGNLWVDDPRNHRVTVFDSTGAVTSYGRQARSYGYILNGGLDPEDRYYAMVLIHRDTSAIPMLERWDLAAGMVDTLPWPECPAEPSKSFWSFERGSMMIPFATRTQQWFDGHGYIWCGDTRRAAAYRIPLGDSLFDRSYEANVERAMVTGEEREAAIARAREFMARVGPGDADFDDIPETKPVLKAVDSNARGEVWMRVEGRDGDEVLVFDSTGVQRARAAVPSTLSQWLPLRFHENHVYAVATDSLDVPSIVRFRVRGQ